MGLSWDIGSVPDGQSATFSLLSNFSATGAITLPITASGGQSLTGAAGSALSAAVASVSDPNSSDTPTDLSATIDWGDGGTSAGTISGGNGNFSVAGTHTYAQAGSYTITVTVTRNAANSAVATDSALITSTPTSGATGLGTVGITAAGFTGSVVPGGLPTTAYFQYGLDPKYTGGGPVVYTNSTTSQPVGSDFSSHPVSASVSGLVSNAVYHVRLVATNSVGTTFGPDATFTTLAAPPPKQPPILGQTFNLAPVSGVVLVKINGVFVPLTQLTQIPQNVQINALHGTLQLITAGAGPSPARDAAAKGKKHKTKVKTQKGTFGGAIFKLNQAKRGAAKGLVTLTLVENAFIGAPSYAVCKTHKAREASAAALSSKTLQTLRASAKGRFTTKGKYGSATVRGTKWSTADRCDGTLIHDVSDSVAVTHFVRHKTIVLDTGQSYLAKAPKRNEVRDAQARRPRDPAGGGRGGRRSRPGHPAARVGPPMAYTSVSCGEIASAPPPSPMPPGLTTVMMVEGALQRRTEPGDLTRCPPGTLVPPRSRARRSSCCTPAPTANSVYKWPTQRRHRPRHRVDDDRPMRRNAHARHHPQRLRDGLGEP
jgi:hypothetical protein